MKKKIFCLLFILSFTFSYSQIFSSQKGDLINFNTKEIKVVIDDFEYKGTFQSFTSKKDKKEYLIFNYFSRSIVVSINKSLNEISNSMEKLKIEHVKLIHSSKLKEIIKEIKKKGINNLNNFIVINNNNKSFYIKNTVFDS